jgi:hypothetical protein
MINGDSVIPILSDGDFSAEDWRYLTNTLKFAEPIFQRLAAELNLRLLSSARWPELRLKQRGRWTVTELRLSLHPGVSENQEAGSQWAVNLVRYPRFSWLPCGTSDVEAIDVLTQHDLVSDGRMRDCLQVAARRAFPQSKSKKR